MVQAEVMVAMEDAHVDNVLVAPRMLKIRCGAFNQAKGSLVRQGIMKQSGDAFYLTKKGVACCAVSRVICEEQVEDE